MRREAVVWRVLAAGLACVVVAGSMRAQGTGAADAVTQPQMMAKDADPDWDAVSVKLSDPIKSKTTFDIRGRHIIVGNQTVETMLLMSHGLQKDQIIGGPDWVRTEHFDADGVSTVEGQPNLKQFQTMVGKLLLERFGLVTHTEQRELSVYALTVAKGGPKMTLNTSNPNGLQHATNSQNGGQKSIEEENITMDGFAVGLLFNVDRPVLNETGLTGRYDLKLKWTFDEQKAPTDGSAAPSLFTAIQEQMGLRLEQVKRMTDVMVIDKVERPGAN
jgi:uncharacterized protein (TIGR03435 family)